MSNHPPIRRSTRNLLWLVLAAPLASITYTYSAGHLFYGEYLHLTGDWSTKLLILALAVTPLRRMLPHARPIAWLHRQRRYLGVAAFAYALAHVLAYLLRLGVLERILDESLEPGMLAGWVALLILVPLAATSNDWTLTRLGHRWKALHRLVYLAALLTIAHWVVLAFDPLPGFLHAGLLVLLEAYRIAKRRRDRRVAHTEGSNP